MKLKDRIDAIIVRAGLYGGRGATTDAAGMITRKKGEKGKHAWVDGGIAQNGLGRNFGDHSLVCSKCGAKITYAAIDHDHFERYCKENPCTGGEE